MSEKQVLGVAKQLERIGATLLSVPASTIIQKLTYSELSAFLDRMVYDMYIYSPELFNKSYHLSDGSGALCPAVLKLYFYGLALDWFQKQGCLSTSGGLVAPDATGMNVPTPLMAWLSYIARYREGGTEAVPAYAVSVIPAVATTSILPGVAVETDLSRGLTQISMFFPNTTFDEMQLFTTASPSFDGITLPDFWSQYSKVYSDMVKRGGYPVVEMPETVPMAPDGSFFCTIWNGGLGGSITASNAYLGSAFHKVDREIALLYYDGTESEDLVAQAVRTFPVVLPYSWTSVNTAASVSTPVVLTGPAAFDVAKGYFILCLRTMNFVLGMNVGRDKNWAGESISSFYPIQRVTTMEYYSQAIISVIEEVAKISNAPSAALNPLPFFDASKMMAFFVWHHLAALVRLQPYRVEYDAGTPGGAQPGSVPNWKFLMPASFRAGMKVHSALAVALNELGPVVCDGRLNLPAFKFMTDVGWYNAPAKFANTLRTGTHPQAPLNYAVASTQPGSWAPTFKWGNQTLDATWVSGYTALTGTLFVPWQAAARLGEVAVLASTNTVAYGRGFTFFPMSNNIRGGLGMLAGAQCLPTTINDLGSWTSIAQSVRIIDMNTNANAGTATELSSVNRNIQAIASSVPLSPEEMAVVMYVPWIIELAKDVYSKYRLVNFDSGGVRSIQTTIATDLCSPGGVFMQMLSEAMMKRHGSISSLGVVGPNDNPDVCLWDAAKAIFRTIGTTLLDIAPVAAGMGCNVIAPGTGPGCSLLAGNVAATIKDLAGVGTIRHSVTEPKKELDKITKETREVARASKGLDPQQRSKAPRVDYKVTAGGVKPVEVKHPKPLGSKEKGVKKSSFGKPLAFPSQKTKVKGKPSAAGKRK